VALAFAAIVVPFGLRDVGKSGAQASPATHAAAPPRSAPAHQPPAVDAAVGPRGHLPALLPARSTRLSDGLRVRLGVITDGVLRRTPGGTGQVWVRWNGRLQPVPTRGPVQLIGATTGHPPSSWVSDQGLLYTRVALARPGRFRVFAWAPRGATAYTPPTLVAKNLGLACFNRSFTAFGDCGSAG
jgi:hypothetical protein